MNSGTNCSISVKTCTRYTDAEVTCKCWINFGNNVIPHYCNSSIKKEYLPTRNKGSYFWHFQFVSTDLQVDFCVSPSPRQSLESMEAMLSKTVRL